MTRKVKNCLICRQPTIGNYAGNPICIDAYRTGGIVDKFYRPDLVKEGDTLLFDYALGSIYLKKNFVCSNKS